MSDVNQEQHLAPLPETLRLQLEKFKRHLWRIKITEAILAGFLGLIISFALVFALERMFEIPPVARLVILLAGISIFAIFAPLWINRWVFKHRKENQIARLISKHYPNLGDRLLGVVELQDQNENSKALSPELREAAMIAVAHDAKDRDLGQAVSSSWRNKLAFGTAITALIAGVAFAIFPNAGRNALKRWFMPLSDTERYVFTKVDRSKLPNPLYVAMDEPFSIPLTLQSDTESTPEFAEAKYNSGKWNQFDYDKAQYLLKFKGKRTKGTVYYKLGDASHELEVRPVKRPKLGSIKGKIRFPEYLQREQVSEDFIAGQITVLEGSKLTIHAQADRKLSSAVVGPLIVEPFLDNVSAEDAEIQELDPENLPQPTKEKIAHSINGSTVIPQTLDITRNTLRLPISWTDKYDIAGLRATELTVTPSQDMAPTTYIQGIEKQVFIKHDQTIEFSLHADDDYGIKAAGISWVGSFNTPSPSPPAKGEEQNVAGDPYGTSALETVVLDFKQRGIQPQKLTIRTWVDDYNPATPRVYSEPIEVYLLTEAEHAEYIKKQNQEVNRGIEEAIRKEMENMDENKRIQKGLKNEKDPKKADEAKKKLDTQLQKELENKEKIEELSKKMDKILKEAMKNKSIDTKALKGMKKTADALKEMAEKDMPEIAEKLDDAQSQKNSDEKTQEDVKEAIEKQEKLVDKMKDAAQKAEDTNEQMEQSTFVNRLKQAAKEEGEIAAGLLGDDNLVSGKYYSDLDPERQRVMQALYLKQKQTGIDVRWIQEDLSFFHTRTQKPIHKKIYDDMEASKIDDGLRYVEDKIADSYVNVPMQHADYWKKKLNAWAKELDGAGDDGGGGGGGGGGGDGGQEDKDFEFMIRVMKMIQIEQQIRARTRALEQKRRNAVLGNANPQP